MPCIVVCGGTGRLGREILKQVDGAVGFGREGNLEDFIEKADVVIDVSLSDATYEVLKTCAKHKKPVVIGSTGHENWDAMAKEFSGKVAIFKAENFSIGMNTLYGLSEKAANELEGFDVNVIETHHRWKKDNPSGSAKKLISKMGRGEAKGMRGGDVIGEHRVFFIHDGEEIEIRHRVWDRRVFARGAIKAAKWLVDQKPGIYGMEKIL